MSEINAAVACIRRLRNWANFWMAPQTLAHQEALRLCELEVALQYLPRQGRLLEIGSGTGWQARELSLRGYDVSTIDIRDSNYLAHRIWPVIDYDGKTIPFEDGRFDIVFSSNVLEHIAHVREFQKEIQRVLSPGGLALHLVPSSTWRIWTSLTTVIRCWVPPVVHGEHASNAFREVVCFRQGWWQRLFRETGWTVSVKSTNKLFYTGQSVFDSRLSIDSRKRLAGWLGASCNLFVLRKS